MARWNAAHILLLFRDGTASDWASLCHALGLNPSQPATLVGTLRMEVVDLLAARLLIADDPINFSDRGNIKLANNVSKIFTALDLSLKEMAAVYPPASMFVQPLFGRPNTIPLDEQFDLFVLMPFSSEMKGVYEDHIKKVATRLELKVARADDFFAAGVVMADIWTAICMSRVVIADCTSRNPNVFYEIGLAHTVGKHVILITRDSTDVPFDLRHYRYIRYEYTPRGMNEFEGALANTLQTELRRIEDTQY